MWSLFLIGHLYLSCIWLGFSYGCMSKFKHHSRSNRWYNWLGLCDHLEKERILTWPLFDLLHLNSNFGNLKWRSSSAIGIGNRWDKNLSVELEVSTVRPCALMWICYSNELVSPIYSLFSVGIASGTGHACMLFSGFFITHLLVLLGGFLTAPSKSTLDWHPMQIEINLHIESKIHHWEGNWSY